MLVACRLKPYESDSDDEDYNVDFEDETKLPPIEIPPGDHKLQVSLYSSIEYSSKTNYFCSTAIISGTRERVVIEHQSIRNLFISSDDVRQLNNGGVSIAIS